MSVFINPFTDLGFKRIFGQEFSKPMLLDFLNKLLKGERHLTDLTFLDKEQICDNPEDRSLIYDVYCETDTGEKIIVEMQNRHQPMFKNRSIYYISRAISNQGEKGIGWQYDIKAVYMVAFLNFSDNRIGSTLRTDVALMNTATKEIFSDKLRLIYLQLPLFNKEIDECDNDFEHWIYVLKNMENLQRMPFALQNSVFRRLADIAEVGALSHEERIQYDQSIKRYRDTLNVLKGAREKGEIKGRKEVAARMLSKGMSTAEVADLSGIPIEVVETLQTASSDNA